MDREYGFIFRKEQCIQCHGCEIACKNWRNVELGKKWRWVENILTGQFPSVRSRSVSMSCLHCVQPSCMEACPEDAITKGKKDGIVRVDKKKCVGCRTCYDACPIGVPQFGVDGIMQKCDMCVDLTDHETHSPPCVVTCPTNALTVGLIHTKDKVAVEKIYSKEIMNFNKMST